MMLSCCLSITFNLFCKVGRLILRHLSKSLVDIPNSENNDTLHIIKTIHIELPSILYNHAKG